MFFYQEKSANTSGKNVKSLENNKWNIGRDKMLKFMV